MGLSAGVMCVSIRPLARHILFNGEHVFVKQSVGLFLYAFGAMGHRIDHGVLGKNEPGHMLLYLD